MTVFIHSKFDLNYHDCVTRRGIVVIASQYCSMYGMISSSLSKNNFVLPFFCAACCILAIAVTHICDIAINWKTIKIIVFFKHFWWTLTYMLGIFGSFPSRLENSSCKRKCNWWPTVSTCPVEIQCMTRGTSDNMLRTAIQRYWNYDLCHCCEVNKSVDHFMFMKHF